MRKIRIVFLITSVFVLTVMCSGCWHYREVDSLSIVTGIAIDKGVNGNYLVTFEIADTKDNKLSSKIIEMEGDTIFDATRNSMKILGKKLYLSHTKVVIVNKNIASEGISEVLDFLNRDAEARMSLNILISKEETAKEILKAQSISESIHSFEIYSKLRNQVNLCKAPNINLKGFIYALSCDGISAVLPAVGLTNSQGYITSEVLGTAVFKKDKLIGLLNEDETKLFLIITNEAKRGLIIEKNIEEAKPSKITLEIILLENTIIKPVYENGRLQININTLLNVALGEQIGGKEYESVEGRKALKRIAEERINKDINSLIKKVQLEYGTDIFGFGKLVRAKKPELWRTYENNWSEQFKNLNIRTASEIKIRNSGLSVKPIKVGD